LLAAPADAGTWSAPAALFPPDATDHTGSGPMHIAIDNAGYGVAVFSRSTAGVFALRVATRRPGGTWTLDPTVLTTDVQTLTDYDASIDPAGNALVVWDADNGTTQTLWGSTLRAGAASWSIPGPIAFTLSSQEHTDQDPVRFSASANASGRMVIAWQSVQNVIAPGCCEMVTSIWGIVGSPAAGFGPAVLAAQLDGIDMGFDMTTAVGPAGDAAIQWTEGHDGTNIRMAIGPAATGFPTNSPVAVTTLVGPEQAEGGSVSIDGAGDVLSVFAAQGTVEVPVPGEYPTTAYVGSSYRPAGGTFGGIQRITTWEGNDRSNQIFAGFDARGTATLVLAVLAPPGLIGETDSLLEVASRGAGVGADWSQPTVIAGPGPFGSVSFAEVGDGSMLLGLDSSELLSRTGYGPFGDATPLPCYDATVSLAADGDAAAGCSTGYPDNSGRILARDLVVHAAPASSATGIPAASVGASAAPEAATAARRLVAVGLRAVRVARRTIVLRGRATGRATVRVTIRRHAHRMPVEVLRFTVHGGAWRRVSTLPRRFVPGRYDVIVNGTDVRAVRTSVRLAARARRGT
jgi:hypothetical protein